VALSIDISFDQASRGITVTMKASLPVEPPHCKRLRASDPLADQKWRRAVAVREINECAKALWRRCQHHGSIDPFIPTDRIAVAGIGVNNYSISIQFSLEPLAAKKPSVSLGLAASVGVPSNCAPPNHDEPRSFVPHHNPDDGTQPFDVEVDAADLDFSELQPTIAVVACRTCMKYVV